MICYEEEEGSKNFKSISSRFTSGGVEEEEVSRIKPGKVEK